MNLKNFINYQSKGKKKNNFLKRIFKKYCKNFKDYRLLIMSFNQNFQKLVKNIPLWKENIKSYKDLVINIKVQQIPIQEN